MPAVEVVAQFVCIQLHDKIPMPGFLVFPMMGVDALIVNVLVFTLASWINTRSEDILIQFGKRLNTMKLSSMEQKIVKKAIKSCLTMSIKFGSNFIDRATPLVIQHFCINQAVSLILIKSRYDI